MDLVGRSEDGRVHAPAHVAAELEVGDGSDNGETAHQQDGEDEGDPNTDRHAPRPMPPQPEARAGFSHVGRQVSGDRLRGRWRARRRDLPDRYWPVTRLSPGGRGAGESSGPLPLADPDRRWKRRQPRSWFGFRAEAVPRSAYSAEQLEVEASVDLVAKILDVHVHDVRGAVVPLVPHGVEQLRCGSRPCPAWRIRHSSNGELARREIHLVGRPPWSCAVAVSRTSGPYWTRLERASPLRRTRARTRPRSSAMANGLIR